MIPKLKDIIDILEKIVPSLMAEEWDNPGLQIGNSSQEIKKILISLDPTIKALKKASDRNAQLLLTHHPLIFKPLSCLNQNEYPGDVIFEAFRKGISIFAAHTNLDVMRGGINDILANLFGLQDIQVLQKKENVAMNGAGLGRIGDLLEPMGLATMIETVKAVLGTNKVKVVGNKNIKIKRVAVVGGSGGGMISLASKKGADLFISGDITHHEALEAESLGMALIDGGHFHTEKAALTLFANRLKDTLIDQGWDVIIEVNTDERGPMRYE